MNYLSIKRAPAMLLLIFFISCSTASVRFSRIEYNIPDHISIKTEDLKRAMGEIQADPSSGLYIAVTLYSYSSGTETISFSGGDEVKTAMGRGKLKALVKVMDGKTILSADFVEASGENKEEMLLTLAKEIKLKLIK